MVPFNDRSEQVPYQQPLLGRSFPLVTAVLLPQDPHQPLANFRVFDQIVILLKTKPSRVPNHPFQHSATDQTHNMKVYSFLSS